MGMEKSGADRRGGKYRSGKCGSIGRRGEKCRSRLAVWDITSYGTYRPIVSEKILTKTVASWPNYIVFLLPSIVIL